MHFASRMENEIAMKFIIKTNCQYFVIIIIILMGFLAHLKMKQKSAICKPIYAWVYGAPRNAPGERDVPVKANRLQASKIYH